MTTNSQSNPALSKLATVKIDNASLCSLAVALWGYQTQLFLVAFIVIIILEARHVVRQRWEISFSDLKEAAKLCGALLAILFVVIITVKKAVFIYTLIQWLPVAGLPLLIAQTYGIGVSELLSDRLSNPHHQTQVHLRTQHRKPKSINLHYLYFGVCIVAASAADSDHFVFYSLATALTALLLWPLRPKRTSPILWLLLFCLSAGLGFAGHRQLANFQQQLETRMIAMIGSIASGSVDPDGTATRMGSIGRLKLSNRIAFRIKVDNTPDTVKPDFPLLLQEATYNQYGLAIWKAENSLFSDVPPGEEDGDWVLGPETERNSTIIISTDLERGEGVLTLPRGVSTLQQLPVEEMQRNQYGAVQVNAKGSAEYKVQFQGPVQSPGVRSLDARPTQADLLIPNVDAAAVESVLSQLALEGKSEPEIVSQIAAYFQDFQYSLDLLQPPDNVSAVSDFLLNTQAGHCEYFASATTLLLRAAGIPARYAVGYSAHEFSNLEGQYIVRSRDAHAWTLYYLGDRWQILDTTPPDWSAQEAAATSFLQAIPDLFSFLGFQFAYRIRQLGELGLKEILMIVIPLFCYLLWRSIQVFQGQKKDAKTLEASESQIIPNGLDSELFQIETILKEQGLERGRSESFLQWCDRLQSKLPNSQQITLEKILALHYQYRFDPQGLNPDERQQLRTMSQEWIDQNTLETAAAK
ncbi:MAG: transglutaminase-like domain-containing protein [Cyanobacteria bacterium J06621_3]